MIVSTGFTKQIDKLGRLALPMEIRKFFDLERRESAVELFTEDDLIILKKYDEACVFCGESEDLRTFKNKKVCLECVGKITSD